MGDRGRRVGALLGAVLVATAGCGGAGPGAAGSGVPASPAGSLPATDLAAPKLVPGAAVPTPAGTPVLTVTGRIERPNTAAGLSLDVETIEQLGLRQVTLYDPWAKRRLSFRGVWLADLLDVAGVAGPADAVHLTALDDYEVDLRMTDVRAGGIFLATKTGDGASIPVADGGPTRIVFVGDVPSGRDAKQWIWSLKTLEVR